MQIVVDSYLQLGYLQILDGVELLLNFGLLLVISFLNDGAETEVNPGTGGDCSADGVIPNSGDKTSRQILAEGEVCQNFWEDL